MPIMARGYFFIIIFLVILIALLAKGIFFGENSIFVKEDLINKNIQQKAINDQLEQKNISLEFEINNSKNKEAHTENYAREKLNLVYPDEEFIKFKELNNDKESEEDNWNNTCSRYWRKIWIKNSKTIFQIRFKYYY